MENIISEFKVIETDDGFRIEIKGDKEQIKAFMSGFTGRRDHKKGYRRGWRGAWGAPFGFHPMMWMNMAQWFGPWDFEEEDESDSPEEA